MNNNRVSLKVVVDNARRVYADLDPKAAKRANELDAKCTKGCAACSYQLVGCTLVEAFVIVEELTRWRSKAQLNRLLLQLDEQCALLRQADARAATFLSQRPCALLARDKADPFKGLCSVYASRPLACRLQFVISDPRWCQPDAIYECTMVDTIDVQLKATAYLVGGSPSLAIYGPLQPLLAHALRVALGQEDLNEAYLLEWQSKMGEYLAHDKKGQAALGLKDKYVR